MLSDMKQNDKEFIEACDKLSHIRLFTKDYTDDVGQLVLVASIMGFFDERKLREKDFNLFLKLLKGTRKLLKENGPLNSKQNRSKRK